MADELIRVGSDLPAAPPLMNVTATGEGTAIGFVQGDVRLEMNEEAILIFDESSETSRLLFMLRNGLC